MSLSSRFAVGVHILTLIESNKAGVSSSEFIASSVNTNPVVIRKIIGMLKRSGIVEVHPGVAGAKLLKKPGEISLLEIYKSVEVLSENALFNIHENPNPNCIVGKNIQRAIEPVFSNAQLAMEKELSKVTLADIIKSVEH